MNQEELYHRWKALSKGIELLSGYVQNDFEQMLSDNTTTITLLRLVKNDFNSNITKKIEEIEILRDETLNLFDRFIKS